jgi:hypothetical protein
VDRDIFMALRKTEHGRNALEVQSAAGLSLLERRVLILCDGRRNRKDIVALLGADALPMIERLLHAGYLSSHGDAPRLATSRSRTVKPQAAVAERAKAAAAERPKAPVSRRSLSVSKIYLTDMMQVQRDPQSVSLRTQIQASPSEDELVYHMMNGLRHLQEVATASYARRVGDRLAEILPEQYLPRLQYVRASWLESDSAVA